MCWLSFRFFQPDWLKTGIHVRWVPSWFRSLTTNESFKMPSFEAFWRRGNDGKRQFFFVGGGVILMGGQVHGRFLRGNDVSVLWQNGGTRFDKKKRVAKVVVNETKVIDVLVGLLNCYSRIRCWCSCFMLFPKSLCKTDSGFVDIS